ncbi:MAG: DegT/DnrJ/EryC1/StrS family aminotransferase [Verrucomicrobiales bacterium]|nr:DegT/DnrJ/EryC1/StrS family aminotransferase [Verrucomicrobiales bacterium]
MPVPLLDVNAQNLPLQSELEQVFREVLQHGRFIMGPEVAAFEEEVAQMLEVEHAVAVSSGTDALLMALMALEIGPGDEVLCPAFTFFATAGAIHRLGATPVFVDVCPVCFNLDVEDAAAKVTTRTRAIMPVHLFGQSAPMDAVLALSQKHGLAVVEDAAQAIGARYHGRACGAMGDFGTYSFFPSKNLGGFGDGGMVVTRDAAHAARLRSLRNHGMEPKYYHSHVGGNFRMDTLQAALLRTKLRHYAAYTAARQSNAAHYTAALSQLPGVVVADPAHCQCARHGASAAADAAVVLPVACPGNDHIWNQYTLRLGGGRRDAVKQALLEAGIGCEVYYPVTLDQQACFASLPEASRQGCEVSHQLALEVLSLPIYGELVPAQLDEVVAAVTRALA